MCVAWNDVCSYYANTVGVCCLSLSLLAARLTIRISLSFQGDEAYLVSPCSDFSTRALQGFPRGRGSSCAIHVIATLLHTTQASSPTSARPLPQSSMTARLHAGQCELDLTQMFVVPRAVLSSSLISSCQSAGRLRERFDMSWLFRRLHVCIS